ncbi:MAG: DUF1848 domain-containing protein [Nitrospinota bacterium]|nr:DUF1848 domain-containing protein [Nitrospinota bacterium]
MDVPRIISISRRGDIPAFHTPWLINRLGDGYCHFQTPYGGKIREVSLKPEDCDGLVFWTRNPFPLFNYINELKDHGYCFYFHFTITGYPNPIESHTPPLLKSIERFINLSEKIGSEAVHWRYDPVILSSLTSEAFHIENFSFIANKLKKSTGICTISFIQFYEKSRGNFKKITEQHGIRFDNPSMERKIKLAKTLKGIAAKNGINLRSCCDNSLLSAGILKGSCVGPEYLSLIKRQVAASTIRYGKPNWTASRGKPPEGLRPWKAELSSALPIIKWSYRTNKQTENSFKLCIRHCKKQELTVPKKKKLLQCNIIKTDSYGNWEKRPTRKGCACFESVDIGTYETCTFGCCYCYATRSRESALKHLKNYDKNDSILVRPKKFNNKNIRFTNAD